MARGDGSLLGSTYFDVLKRNESESNLCRLTLIRGLHADIQKINIADKYSSSNA